MKSLLSFALYVAFAFFAAAAITPASAQVPPVGPSGPVKCMCYCGVYLDPPCSESACKTACGYKGRAPETTGQAPSQSLSPSSDRKPVAPALFGRRVAELPQCVELGHTCVIGGTRCCGTATCKGKFPNTTCQ